MINRGTRRLVAMGVVVAACAVALPGSAPAIPAPPGFSYYTLCFDEPNVSCSVSGVTPEAVPVSTRRPQPTRLSTNGVAGCFQGESRPVVDTVVPVLSVVFTDPSADEIRVTFEEERLDGTGETEEISTSGLPGEKVELEPGENGLEPGASYRWRVRGTDFTAVDPGWSPWCEYTVAAGLVDLREATDPAVVTELGVTPGRRYPVTLTAREWKLVAEAVEEFEDDGTVEEFETAPRTRLDLLLAAAGSGPTRTLTGDQWAAVAAQTAATASAQDMYFEEDPEVAGRDGTGFWTALDRISVQLGGPARPSLGYYR
ncbi:hypothetical protein [Actinoplanes derwentensis]|uniref:Ig-like domain-containing protein n=1 Tax=Actinoplanes derwentensis TaxID=113562 RepID=A0A1H1SEL4_9ACTN|nr:hypothetical protein [Actinoplanes derwentensis]GID83322.1 hypothetical protein Ade03nite_22460 [Actinoplanes derwentensis]SDS46417.1 hypothetical protein SAMN04489716_0839 [Actinoplanes derwentensis]